jgi:hypothetical protein
MAKRMGPGAAWLAANDPQYVSPIEKAARTRMIPVDPMALAAFMGRGGGVRKVGGRYTQAPVLGFEGGTGEGDGECVPVVDAVQESTVDRTRNEAVYGGVRRRGKRGGKQSRKGK